MDLGELLVAIVAGIIQGIFEWLPISSQGNLSAFFTFLCESADVALQLTLFLHLGTTIAAAVYYRETIGFALSDLPEWRPRRAFEGTHAEPSFVVVAALVTGLVGVPLYVLVIDIASDVSGAVFVVAIGALLVLTGVLQLASDAVSVPGAEQQIRLFEAEFTTGSQIVDVLDQVVDAEEEFWTGYDEYQAEEYADAQETLDPVMETFNEAQTALSQYVHTFIAATGYLDCYLPAMEDAAIQYDRAAETASVGDEAFAGERESAGPRRWRKPTAARSSGSKFLGDNALALSLSLSAALQSPAHRLSEMFNRPVVGLRHSHLPTTPE